MVMDYKIVTAEPGAIDDLRERVLEMLVKGFIPIGGPFVFADKDSTYGLGQAVVKNDSYSSFGDPH